MKAPVQTSIKKGDPNDDGRMDRVGGTLLFRQEPLPESKWILTSPAHSHLAIPMTVPGDNYHALYQAGVITNPYMGTNENEVQWVRECDWHLSQEFSLSPQEMSAASLILNLSRIDTLANVFINNELVLISFCLSAITN